MSNESHGFEASRLADLQSLFTKVASDPMEVQRFAGSVNGAPSLAAFTAERGVVLTASEAEAAYEALANIAAAKAGAAGAPGLIEDAELAGVVGGVNWGSALLTFVEIAIPVAGRARMLGEFIYNTVKS
ncbi:hypothetical protein [Aquabacter sediminis]|uniref:hypothetical protein n=1 Tax=Aquabacter sediminis TaxID=3029197 RepID=UPI00237E2220|nr:hypothetical protein [Aquabacter sp. P-9]MDE1569023.1 hypothetical protein [Aquabacter sp. P-9]